LPLDLMLTQAASTYRARAMSSEEATNIVVPTLTAGTIVQTTPAIGDTLTVTGSNAPAGATFLWQVDTGGGFGSAGGTNNAASYDTTGRPAGDYRRGVSTAGQSMVYTPAVAVGAAPTGFAVNEKASGGSFSTSGGFRIWTATNGAELVVTNAGAVNALIVGGGGGGGGRRGGGGGAGEYVLRLTTGTPLELAATTYTATVGAGGTGGNNADGTAGGNSAFAGLTGLGGGFGGSLANAAGAGGSGGGGGDGQASGGASTAVDGIGNAGAGENSNSSAGGGGGGAGAAATPGATGVAGNGGAGVASPVPGESGFYAGGGGGGGGTTSAIGTGGSGVGGDGGAPVEGIAAQPGVAGTGSGGGGGHDDAADPGYRQGGNGGSGVVKIWWAI